DEATRVALADFRDGDLLARHMAPLRQAHSPEPITLGATRGHYFSDLLEDIRYGARMMNSINDIIVAARGLRKAAVFTSVAIISLALAIGSISTISAIVEAVLLRPLPAISQPNRLVSIYNSNVTDPRAFTQVSWQDFEYYRSSAQSF